MIRKQNYFSSKRNSKKRTKETISPRMNSYLIVTEGTRTEPNYFNGLKKQIEENIKTNIKIVAAKPEIKVMGKGISTRKLIEEVDRIVERGLLYQNVWIVFDKDDYVDFDDAIKLCKKKGYKVAWSNQCFEYWLYLHFKFSDSALHRKNWISKLDEKMKELGHKGYDKNLNLIFNFVSDNGGVGRAIKNSKKRMEQVEPGTSESTIDPGTTVHELVEELLSYV